MWRKRGGRRRAQEFASAIRIVEHAKGNARARVAGRVVAAWLACHSELGVWAVVSDWGGTQADRGAESGDGHGLVRWQRVKGEARIQIAAPTDALRPLEV